MGISFSQTLSAPPTSHTITVQARKTTTDKKGRPECRALAGDPQLPEPSLRNEGGCLSSPGAVSNFPKGYRDLHGGNPSSCAGSGDSPSSRTTQAPSLPSPKGLAWSHWPLRSAPYRLSLPGSGFPGHPPPARPTRPVPRQQSPAARPREARSPLAGR